MIGVLVFFPFAAGLISWALGDLCHRKNIRDGFAVLSVVAEFLLMLYLAMTACMESGMEPYIEYAVPGICGLGITFVLDGFRVVYGLVAAFMWMMVTILSGEYFNNHHNRNRFYLFLLWTLGATMGVFLSGDLYTTFIFFEMMSFTSYVWVAQEENRPALRAAETYLAIAVIGGLVMLMGIFLLYHQLGTLVIAELLPAARALGGDSTLYVAGCCMLFGFGAKAGAFPLHIWLPKAHPVAPAPASALLSGILTKTGIYGTLILSCNLFLYDTAWGSLVLAIGVLTMVGGALLAVFSVDLKRTLACSSMSQIGFILVGIGMQGLLGEENAPAVHGTLLHMVNHSLIKLVLFMAAGVIFMNTHALDLNEIRGFGRKKPLLLGSFLIGALAIGGIPLFGGYVSKTLLHEAILEYGGGTVMKAVEWSFLFSGGLTVAYMTKLFIAIFIEKNESAVVQEKYDESKRYMNPGSCFALTGSALVLFLWGIVPHATMDRAAELSQGFMHLESAGHAVRYFSPGNLEGALISIVIGVIVYVFFVRKVLMRKSAEGEKPVRRYVNLWPKWLDLEELLYRPLLLGLLPAVFGVLCRLLDSFADTVVVLLRKSVYRDSPLPYELPEGNALTAMLGSLMNRIQSVCNHTWRRKAPAKKDYVHILAIWNEEFKENNMIIRRSLSFGLLLCLIGLTLTLVYIILW